MKGIRHKKRLEKIAEASGIDFRNVSKIIDMYYEGIASKIKAVKLEDKLYSKEEFESKMKTVLIPRIGSFVPNYAIYEKSKKAKLAREKSSITE